MADFQLTITNLPQLRKSIDGFPSIATPILQKTLLASQFIFQNNTLKDDPVPVRTGFLLQSFRFSSDVNQARWFPTSNYAAFVEFGTRPHEIRPIRAKVLAWQNGASSARYVTAKSGRKYYKKGSVGAMRFAAVVHHPGSRAKPYMQKIVTRSTDGINALFAQAGDLITQTIAEQSS